VAVNAGHGLSLDNRSHGYCNDIVGCVGGSDVPDADQFAILDGHNVADRPDELFAAGAVMLRPLPVNRVRTFGKGCKIGGPEVVSCSVCKEERTIRHPGELSGDSGFENVEIHCGSPV